MILVLGATGFLGKRVCRKLTERNLPFHRSSLSLGTDLRDIGQVRDLFARVKPRFVLNCAAYVGGIQFGFKHPAELFSNNLQMTVNLYTVAAECSVQRIVNPISNCAYPAKATLFREDEFWDGPLHDSVLVYGFVRKASWVGAWAYQKQFGLDVINLILSNMYGPEDHFEAERSHALGALVMKMVNAQRNGDPFVDVWGSGKPVREWLHVDDGSEAMIRAMDIAPYIDPINIGVGQGISILDMAKSIASIVGYTGEIRLDPSKPDGAPYKTVDGSRGRALLGWEPQIDFNTGMRDTIAWFRNHSPEGQSGASR